jgi:protocatechuate 3,4-dioxygenase beta subunit
MVMLPGRRITDLRGRLFDRAGRPIPAARIDIWQCDATGRYHHPRDRGGARTPHFQGFGRAVTDAEGRYHIRTIRPVPARAKFWGHALAPHLQLPARRRLIEPTTRVRPLPRASAWRFA